MTLSTDFSPSAARTRRAAVNSRKPGTGAVFVLFAAGALLSLVVHAGPRLLHLDSATTTLLGRIDLALWMVTLAITLRWYSRTFVDTCVLNWNGDASFRRRAKTVGSWIAVAAMFALLSLGFTDILPLQTAIQSAAIAMLPMIRTIWRNRRHG